MVEIVNLRRARKAARQADKAAAASANRQLHGEPGHLKQQRQKQRRLEEQRLTGHKIEQEP